MLRLPDGAGAAIRVLEPPQVSLHSVTPPQSNGPTDGPGCGRIQHQSVVPDVEPQKAPFLPIDDPFGASPSFRVDCGAAWLDRHRSCGLDATPGAACGRRQQPASGAGRRGSAQHTSTSGHCPGLGRCGLVWQCRASGCGHCLGAGGGVWRVGCVGCTGCGRFGCLGCRAAPGGHGAAFTAGVDGSRCRTDANIDVAHRRAASGFHGACRARMGTGPPPRHRCRTVGRADRPLCPSGTSTRAASGTCSA